MEVFEIEKLCTDNGPNGEPIYFRKGKCLSTDTKTKLGTANGSELREMDSSTDFYFDQENNEWLPQSGGGSGSSPQPYTSDPQMDGVASAGTSAQYSRGDHRHPADTSKQDKIIRRDATLDASDWDNNQQTITVQGISSDETAQIIKAIPVSSDRESYISNGIIAIAQGNNSLTFKCDSEPSDDIDIYVVITSLGV